MGRIRGGSCPAALALAVCLLGPEGAAGQGVHLFQLTPTPTWHERVDGLFDRGKLHESLVLVEDLLEASLVSSEVAWRAVRVFHALGVTADTEAVANGWHEKAVAWAELGLEEAPRDPVTLRWAVVAMGTYANAPGVGPRETARYAQKTWALAHRLLEIAPDDPVAYSAIGSMHAELMTMSGFERFLAGRLLGVDAVRDANWDDALAYQRRAVELAPDHVLYRLELGKALGWQGRTPEAVQELDRALELPVSAPTHEVYREHARALREEFSQRGG